MAQTKHFHGVAEISYNTKTVGYKTKTGEKVTSEMDNFLFYLGSCRNCANVYDKNKICPSRW